MKFLNFINCSFLKNNKAQKKEKRGSPTKNTYLTVLFKGEYLIKDRTPTTFSGFE